MPRAKSPAWTGAEIAILDHVFPREGLNGASDALPDRSWTAINCMASKRGLKSPVVGKAPEPKLQGERLEEAIRLREAEGWSFARIGATLGVCEASVTNAVLIALCPRKGFTPAQRDENGRLLPEGLERLRLMLRKGLKGVEIQLRLGVSAGCVAEQRRRYRADLKKRGKQALPPPGGGQAYSGVKLSREAKRAVEALLLEGYGAKKVTDRTGVSNTSIGRIRNRLIKRLAKAGKTLPGCDLKGRRTTQKESANRIPPAAIAEFRRLLVEERMSARRAGLHAGLGGSAAHHERRRMLDEGIVLASTRRLGRGPDSRRQTEADRLFPTGKIAIIRYRNFAAEHGYPAAVEMLRQQRAEKRQAEREAARRPRTFEEQLARVAAGAKLVSKPDLRRAAPDMTLGGIATGAL